ncbi:MAG: dephospho-CoA kinase [Rhodospirillaceae bacterium]|jgi:dephospho-CoA kinase|nr:dephospho-CoA kinase [Rhodospirillaceae bacterium]
MMILGLTGSIGMGKSNAAKNFRRLGVPVHDADKAVHELLAEDGDSADRIKDLFPDAVKKGALDRELIAKRVFGDADALARIEKILHPMVRRRERAFLGRAARQGRPLVVLDVPLLFETGGEVRCDAVVTVSAPKFIQERRVLKRQGMTRERLVSILARQMPDAEKRRRADFVVLTGLGRDFSLRQILNIVRITSHCRGTNWPPRPEGKGKIIA